MSIQARRGHPPLLVYCAAGTRLLTLYPYASTALINMVSSAATAETTSAPLADFFFIAGVETSQIFDHSMATNNLSSPKLNTTIEEQGQGEEDSNNVALTGVVPQGSSEAKRGSKRFSWDKRKSISSIAALEPKTPGSNRSSVTIKPTAAENARKSGDMNDADFSAALKRFAADRDSVVAEIQFTSGQVPQPNKPVRVRPKTQRFALEDMQTSQKSGIGSVRRRLSTMNPLTRSGTSRRCEFSSPFDFGPDGIPVDRDLLAEEIESQLIKTSQLLRACRNALVVTTP